MSRGRRIRLLTVYIKIQRISQIKVSQAFSNPVRAGFDQFAVQPHLQFCHAIKINLVLSQRLRLPPSSPKGLLRSPPVVMDINIIH